MYIKSYNKSYNKKTKHFHQKVLHILYFNIEHVLQIWMYTFIGNVCFFVDTFLFEGFVLFSTITDCPMVYPV